MRRWALVGAAAAIVVTGCDADPSPPTPEDLRAVDVSPDHTISVDEDGFEPSRLEIRAGEVVRLVNAGDEEHSFTAEERFDTGLLEPGEDTTVVLTTPGEVPYRDLENPDVEGTLTIVPRGG